VRTAYVHLIDFQHPNANDWLAVNQVAITGHKNRRPDVLIFVNGIPLGLLELKNPAASHATLRHAWNQVQTYRADIPAVFTPNAVAVISDSTSAAMSAFTGGFEHFSPWKTIDGREVSTSKPALEVLIKGVFEPARFLDLVRSFVVFSDEPQAMVKRVAEYHQFWAVNAAVESTVVAAGAGGDRRGGVVWHTQGSGKSIEMLLYAAKVMRGAASWMPRSSPHRHRRRTPPAPGMRKCTRRRRATSGTSPMMAHIGVDAGTGYVHSITANAANVHDLDEITNLVRADDEVVYADAGYQGVDKPPEILGDEHLSGVEFRVAARKGVLKTMPAPDRISESRKASVRAKVEHPFLIMKRDFGFTKTRYRGIGKNLNHLHMLFASANWLMRARAVALTG
jgi:IS5 family transposase